MVSFTRGVPFLFYALCEAKDGTRTLRTIFLSSLLFVCCTLLTHCVWLARGWREAAHIGNHFYTLFGLAISLVSYVLFCLAVHRARRIVANDHAEYDAIWTGLVQDPSADRELSELRATVGQVDLEIKERAGGGGLGGGFGASLKTFRLAGGEMSEVRQLLPSGRGTPSEGLEARGLVRSLDQLFAQVRQASTRYCDQCL